MTLTLTECSVGSPVAAVRLPHSVAAGCSELADKPSKVAIAGAVEFNVSLQIIDGVLQREGRQVSALASKVDNVLLEDKGLSPGRCTVPPVCRRQRH